jgi:GrpB-like predicted nucleotidyltransferase (UPF0157 family)
VPFADELGPVEVVAYRETWSRDFNLIASTLDQAGAPGIISIEHVGSTSVPGLAAKNVIDVQVRVTALEREAVIERFSALGYRLRPEGWNTIEQTRSGPEAKLVFASPGVDRRANVHVRTDSSCGAYDTLLFRDFLRDDAAIREAWSEFKCSIVATCPSIDLLGYGQIKRPAWVVLMSAADNWARDHDWRRDKRLSPGE